MLTIVNYLTLSSLKCALQFIVMKRNSQPTFSYVISSGTKADEHFKSVTELVPYNMVLQASIASSAIKPPKAAHSTMACLVIHCSDSQKSLQTSKGKRGSSV